jgi:hypothetical protein
MAARESRAKASRNIQNLKRVSKENQPTFGSKPII